MNLQWTPMRWPAAWKNPEALSLLRNTPINCLVLDPGADLGPIAEQAKSSGLQVISGPPAGARVIQGEWPGVQVNSRRRGGGVSAGPTGVPWLNSNGWRVRLQAALHAGDAIWVDAPPKAGTAISPDAPASAFLDAAAFGGRWIITLDDATAAGIASGNERAMGGWKKLTSAAAFFDQRKAWAGYPAEAVVGVVSSFTGDDEFLSGETLNLLGRANQQYRIVLKDGASEESWRGLRAILYVDAAPPVPALRRQIEAQVQAGKMLIAGPKWGPATGALAADQHPRYEIRQMGKGKVAIAREEASDPYVLANDSVVLVSHRYELLRFFNAGAEISYLAASPDRKQSLLHLLFYSDRGPNDASLWIAGRYRAAMLRAPDRTEAARLEVQPGRDGIELHLPPLSQYAGIELEA